MKAPDLLDYSLAAAGLRIGVGYVERELLHAHNCGKDRGAALDVMIQDLSKIRADMDRLISLAEAPICHEASPLLLVKGGAHD